MVFTEKSRARRESETREERIGRVLKERDRDREKKKRKEEKEGKAVFKESPVGKRERLQTFNFETGKWEEGEGTKQPAPAAQPAAATQQMPATSADVINAINAAGTTTQLEEPQSIWGKIKDLFTPATTEVTTLSGQTLPLSAGSPLFFSAIIPAAGTKTAAKGLEAILKSGNTFKTGTKTSALLPYVNNPAARRLTLKLFGKTFSAKTIVAAGGAIAAAFGSMFLGQWAQAEAPEPVSIVMRDVLRQAEATGDYTLYWEAVAARNELTNLETWEEILMWTPASVIKGIPNKMKGVIAGGVIMDKLAADKQTQQETGESEDDKWARVREEQAAQDKASTDYYNAERKKMLEWEQEAQAAARKAERKAEKKQMEANAKFWADEAEKQREKEAEDRQAIAEFWLEYRKMSQQIADDNRPSNLNFGLL